MGRRSAVNRGIGIAKVFRHWRSSVGSGIHTIVDSQGRLLGNYDREKIIGGYPILIWFGLFAKEHLINRSAKRMLPQIYKNAREKSQLLRFSRSELFAGLFFLGCANGLAGRMIHTIDVHGWADAIFHTFDISVIVLAACFLGISFILDDQGDEISSTDIGVSVALFCLIILPVGAMSWLAVTALSLYILLCTPAKGSRCQGAIILLATTVPMFWGRLLFLLFGNFILNMDALLVGWMLGSHRSGNMVAFADHSGTLVIVPGCSSFTNISLAMLWWITISQVVRHRWCYQDISWCLLACASVVAVNVTRLSLMGLSYSYYDTIHSAWGNTVTNVLTLSLTVLICVLGVRREVFSRA